MGKNGIKSVEIAINAFFYSRASLSNICYDMPWPMPNALPMPSSLNCVDLTGMGMVLDILANIRLQHMTDSSYFLFTPASSRKS